MPGAVAQGMVWGVMAVGVYITFRVLDVADLTVDGSLATGGAVCVMLMRAGCNGVRYADAGKPVHRVAVGGGACGEFEDAAIYAGCDTFVTSDLSYHQFVDAKMKGINLIDAGHFPTEDPVCEVLISYLSERFPDLQIWKSAVHHEAIQYYVEGE